MRILSLAVKALVMTVGIFLMLVYLGGNLYGFLGALM